ncbi:hypothetical protein Avbf_06288, partial [Armadillidium vulgare]
LPETTTRLTEPETTETTTTTTTTTTTLTEDKVEITEKFLHTAMPPVQENPIPRMETLTEGEITINNVILIPKTDPSEPDINLTELINRVGDKFFTDDYVNNVRKGLNDSGGRAFALSPLAVL